MLRIPNKTSVTLTLIVTFVTLALLAAVTVALPSLTYFYLHSLHAALMEAHYTGILVNLYAALVPAYCAVFVLIRLLRNVRQEAVFCDSSVSCLRILSYCCFAETVIFAVLGRFFVLSFLIAFAALFMGLILRVVKNVIGEAVELKNENDLTV